MFEGRSLLIATQHAKEKVIAPLLEKELGVRCRVTKELNTDQFGTFSGEVERLLSPIDTLRKKCKTALINTQSDLVVASEGSFGSHPSLFFAPADDELVMLMDVKNNLEIVARELSLETNFGQEKITTWNELEQFAEQHYFPSHALILKNEKTNSPIKGISRWIALRENYESLRKTSEAISVETDMRACYNPTRMNVIKKATKNLVAKIHSVCPRCGMPGFDVQQLVAGLPCAWCSAPTRSPLAEIYLCIHCSYEYEKKYPHGKTKEDPVYCDYCNP